MKFVVLNIARTLLRVKEIALARITVVIRTNALTGARVALSQFAGTGMRDKRGLCVAAPPMRGNSHVAPISLGRQRGLLGMT